MKATVKVQTSGNNVYINSLRTTQELVLNEHNITFKSKLSLLRSNHSINPMKKSSSFGAYFDFTFHEKTQVLKNTLEFFKIFNTSFQYNFIIVGEHVIHFNFK